MDHPVACTQWIRTARLHSLGNSKYDIRTLGHLRGKNNFKNIFDNFADINLSIINNYSYNNKGD